MQYIPFEEVVAESITSIAANGDDEIIKQFARQWLWRGLQSLGNSRELIAVCRVTPKNLLISKPKDLKQIIDVALYDSSGCLLPHVWHTGKKRIYPQTDALIYNRIEDDGTTTTQFFGPIDLSEDRYNIIIGTNGGDQVSYADIRYWQYQIDKDGLPLIREDEVEALTLYVRYRHSMRRNENQSEIAQNRLEWQRAADQCKAMKKSTTNEEAKTAGRILNRMVPIFNRSQF